MCRHAGYTPVRQDFTFRSEDKNRKQVNCFNIHADTGGSAENTAVVGGHLDSVRAGPGINDNASGLAAMPETAAWLKESGTTPVNRVRFAFWAPRRTASTGPQHYVDELSRAEKPDRGEPERGHARLPEREMAAAPAYATATYALAPRG